MIPPNLSQNFHFKQPTTLSIDISSILIPFSTFLSSLQSLSQRLQTHNFINNNCLS
ncbi:hypothetical protein HanIR_Chr09g0423661 [Helianthus annuus]|nr:hypothetical protein HanIR_Chr09g0423661 [Helianthus annuus]